LAITASLSAWPSGEEGVHCEDLSRINLNLKVVVNQQCKDIRAQKFPHPELAAQKGSDLLLPKRGKK